MLDTSLNENEPVVCKPEEALDCFLRTKMDLLVMGDWARTLLCERYDKKIAFKAWLELLADDPAGCRAPANCLSPTPVT